MFALRRFCQKRSYCTKKTRIIRSLDASCTPQVLSSIRIDVSCLQCLWHIWCWGRAIALWHVLLCLATACEFGGLTRLRVKPHQHIVVITPTSRVSTWCDSSMLMQMIFQRAGQLQEHLLHRRGSSGFHHSRLWSLLDMEAESGSDSPISPQLCSYEYLLQ